MLAIAPAERGGSSSAPSTELARRAFAAGHDALFVFTKPECVTSFEAMNFSLLASDGRAALLEHGRGLERYLEANRGAVREGANGAVVVNCNPFTLGHRHLVEEAARAVEMPCSWSARIARRSRSTCACGSCAKDARSPERPRPRHVALRGERGDARGTSWKRGDAAAIQLELDLLLFAQRIAPFFHVRRRFFGTEPTARRRARTPTGCAGSSRRSGSRRWRSRGEARGVAISASRVRAAPGTGTSTDSRTSSRGDGGVPALDEARGVRERLRAGGGRHA